MFFFYFSSSLLLCSSFLFFFLCLSLLLALAVAMGQFLEKISISNCMTQTADMRFVNVYAKL